VLGRNGSGWQPSSFSGAPPMAWSLSSRNIFFIYVPPHPSSRHSVSWWPKRWRYTHSDFVSAHEMPAMTCGNVVVVLFVTWMSGSPAVACGISHQAIRTSEPVEVTIFPTDGLWQ